MSASPSTNGRSTHAGGRSVGVIQPSLFAVWAVLGPDAACAAVWVAPVADGAVAAGLRSCVYTSATASTAAAIPSPTLSRAGADAAAGADAGTAGAGTSAD